MNVLLIEKYESVEDLLLDFAIDEQWYAMFAAGKLIPGKHFIDKLVTMHGINPAYIYDKSRTMYLSEL